MTVLVDLSPEVEAKLRIGIERYDVDGVRQLLVDAIAPTVDALLQETPEQLNEDEFEIHADRLAAELEARIEPGAPPLSEYAVSRAGIYEDHC